MAKETGEQKFCRQGKSVWIGKTHVGIDGKALPYPIIFEVVERTIKKGQILLFPEYEIDTYWCSLDRMPAKEVITLYHNYGTNKQFHSA
ncbi:MAG: hypothetical protein V2B19_32145 [Pseudomonadota bacterium]